MFRKIISKKKNIVILLISLVVIFIIPIFIYFIYHSKSEAITCSYEDSTYYIGGEAVGIKLLASGVLVMGTDREDVDIQVGDIILEVNGCKIETNTELQEYVALGQTLSLTVSRNDEILYIDIVPKYGETTQEYKLGLWVKDSSAGVGTITFYEKNSSKFAALGHAITETSYQYVLPITAGGITKTQIYMIKKGIAKVPGELKGTLTSDTIGQIYLNTENGIFGTIEDETFFENNEIIELGLKDEIQLGSAYIYVTLDDNVKKKYEIEIERVYLASTDSKNIAILITDEELLEKTGGIVQGMSGAPIVQNGKLIGAITHVFLDDPTRGYGCFIENMVEDMNSI